MSKSKNVFFKTISLLSFFFLFLMACNNSDTKPTETGDQPKPTNDSLALVTAPCSSFERLDNFDMATLAKVKSHQDEGGDCDYLITMYKLDSLNLVYDATSCGEYGKTSTYYLINSSDQLKMIHEKSIENFHNDMDDMFYYVLSETIIDFSCDKPVVKKRTDTLSMDSPESKVKFNDNNDSNAWIVLNENGNHTLFGKKIDMRGDWQATIKKAIMSRLAGMSVFPREIPRTMVGTVGMGFTADIRDICQEALNEAVSIKEFELRQKVDHFKRMTKSFAIVTVAGEGNSIEYWNKKYKGIKKMAKW